MSSYTVPVIFDITGVGELRQVNAYMKSMAGSSGTVARATKSTAKFGSAAQNAGYQVQDFIIQVQGGVDPMRAMSQQLPQLLGPLGLMGAAAGVVAAALPAMIQAFSDGEDEVGDFAEVLGEAETAIGRIGRVMDDLNMDNYVKAWNEATDAQREHMELTLRYQTEMARIAAQGVFDALPTVPEWSDVGAVRSAQVFELGQAFGVAENAARGLIDNLEELENPANRNADSLMRLREELIQIDPALIRDRESYKALIENLWQAEEAMRQVEGISDALTESHERHAEAASAAADQLERVVVAAERIPERDWNGPYGYGDPYGDWRTNPNNAPFDLSDIMGGDDEGVAEQVKEANEVLEIFQKTFDSTVDGIARGTTDISDAFKNMAQSIIAQLGKIAAEWLAVQIATSLFGGTVAPAANGAVMSNGRMTAFAKGGIVSKPTIFPMANGAGLMGEAGPEAIMPLARGRNGKLGVEASGMNVVINNNAAGVEVNPRQTEQGLTIDVVMQQLAASVHKGGNPLTNALENSYSLGRGRGVY